VAEPKEKHGVWGDYNLTFCRLQHMRHGQPYAGVDFIPQSGTKDSDSAFILLLNLTKIF
jgi:hypothetical protein